MREGKGRDGITVPRQVGMARCDAERVEGRRLVCMRFWILCFAQGLGGLIFGRAEFEVGVCGSANSRDAS